MPSDMNQSNAPVTFIETDKTAASHSRTTNPRRQPTTGRGDILAVSAALAIAVISASCSSTRPPSGTPVGCDPARPLYMLASPGDRQADPDRYFAHEYQQINARRGETNLFLRPGKLLGLAMSGGGIRSAAFQLGILSGLHSAKFDGHPILEQVDYVSSVSGGSWANGAYWGATSSDDVFFSGLDTYARLGTNAPNWRTTERILRHEQKVAIFDVTTQRKERWQDDGGKSDNLGLLPLLERGVNTIIVSQMGQDDDLDDLPFSREQAKAYFRANFDETFNPLTVPLVHNESYQCGRKSAARQGRLILIRPTPRNVREFLRQLELTNAPAFEEFFQEDKDLDRHVFPMTATMREEYSPILIRSYYLLGKYISENLLPDALAGKASAR